MGGQIAKEIGINFVKAKKRAKHIGLDEDTKDKIIDFYLRDDITWQAPGRKDRVIIRSKDASGKKVKIHMQCKYMLMFLAEAHQLYHIIILHNKHIQCCLTFF